MYFLAELSLCFDQKNLAIQAYYPQSENFLILSSNHGVSNSRHIDNYADYANG